MVDRIMELPERTRIQILAPVVRGRKGEHQKVIDRARRAGYVRLRIDGNLYDVSEDIKLEKNIKHNIEIVIDRLVIKEGQGGDPEETYGFRRERAAAGGRTSAGRRGGRRDDAVLAEFCLPGLRDQCA